MTTANFPPTANAAGGTATVGYTGGSANYTNLFDASDATTMEVSGQDGYTLIAIGDMPVGFYQASSITINFRLKDPVKGPLFEYVQLMKSDGTTAICGASSSSGTTSFTNYTFTPGSLSYTSKADFDGAKVKIKITDDNHGATVVFAELSVDITYSNTSTNFVPGLDGAQKPYIHSFALLRSTQY